MVCGREMAQEKEKQIREHARLMCPDGLRARFSSKMPEVKFLFICQKAVQFMVNCIKIMF